MYWLEKPRTVEAHWIAGGATEIAAGVVHTASIAATWLWYSACVIRPCSTSEQASERRATRVRSRCDSDAMSNVTAHGSIVGTLEYMSPEQASAAVVDARTDIWALGALMHRALAGRAPFYGSIGGQLYPGTFLPRSLTADFVSTNARSFVTPATVTMPCE